MTVNRLHHLASLIENWDSPAGWVPVAPADSLRPQAMNAQPSAIYGKSDPQFLHSIEPGIRPLVLALIQTLGCITYSSCEGHPTAEQTVQVGQHVDILARDLNEQSKLMEVLDRMALAAPNTATARLRVRRGTVELERATAPSISIEIVPMTGSAWESYRRDADEIQRCLIGALSAAR